MIHIHATNSTQLTSHVWKWMEEAGLKKSVSCMILLISRGQIKVGKKNQNSSCLRTEGYQWGRWSWRMLCILESVGVPHTHQFVSILPLKSVYFNVRKFYPGRGDHKSSSGRWKASEGIDDTRTARYGNYQNFIIGPSQLVESKLLFYFTWLSISGNDA